MFIVCIRFVPTNCIPRGGGGLAVCGVEIRRDTDSCASSIGRLTLTSVLHDILNGRKGVRNTAEMYGLLVWSFGLPSGGGRRVGGGGGVYLSVTTWRHEMKISDAHYHQ